MNILGIFKTSKRRTKHTAKGRTINALRSTGHTPQHPTAVSAADAKRYNIPATCKAGPKGYCIVHTSERWQIPSYGTGGKRVRATRSPRRRSARS